MAIELTSNIALELNGPAAAQSVIWCTRGPPLGFTLHVGSFVSNYSLQGKIGNV